MKKIVLTITGCFILLFQFSCKKLVEINEPRNSLTTVKIFQTEANANSAIAGIYDKIRFNSNQHLSFGRGGCSVFAGLSADELIESGPPNPFQINSLLPDNNQVNTSLWQAAWSPIYLCNATIEGLENSVTLPDDFKKRSIGEAKFLRAFCYFYLINFFGDVPLAITSDWSENYLMSRKDVAEVYNQIIADLKDAQELLPKEYPASGERIKANYWAATSLLSRVYLYKKEWKNAEDMASVVIGSSLFNLVGLDSVFLKESMEAIFQFQTVEAFPYAVTEATYFVPNYSPRIPNYYLTSYLAGALEPGDNRSTAYLGVEYGQGVSYYYPYKYKVRIGSAGNVTEYYAALRLAEQYLIRAEARAQQNTNLQGAITDLNAIRIRAGLPDLSMALSQSQVLDAVVQERRIELLAEWGHRWFDLKRWDKANMVLGPIKGSDWQSTDQLYPIPASELQRDPNLTQNPGYN